jgi:hydroxymethylpyrimidine pyrophosphatase-like HAD family hydrolase
VSSNAHPPSGSPSPAAHTPSTRRRYDLLAIDLDGTLLRRDGTVSEANIAAIRDARDAGIRTVVCTGRGLAECAHVVERIAQEDPVVVAGGAIIACPMRSTTLHRFALELDLAQRAVDCLLEHDSAALVLKDPAAAGYDYLVIDGPGRIPLDPVTLWWFETMRCRVRYLRDLRDDEHPEHTVRVGACAMSGRLANLRMRLEEVAQDRGIVHHFPAVAAPHHVSKLVDGQTLDILEVFSSSATKWSALMHVAPSLGVHDPLRIAAIGDEINDLPMLKNAGLGIAMDNAVPSVKAIARKHTRSNTDDGVAHAIHQILNGDW